jgi:hypothetical protein
LLARQSGKAFTCGLKGNGRESDTKNLPAVDGLVAGLRQEPDTRLRRRQRASRNGAEVVVGFGISIKKRHFFADLMDYW